MSSNVEEQDAEPPELLSEAQKAARDADLDASLFISLDDVARRAGVRTPSVKGLVAALEAGGSEEAGDSEEED